MLGHDLISISTALAEGRLPAILEASDRKARDRIERFLAPPSTTTTPVGPMDGRWACSLPTWRTAAASACRGSTIRKLFDHLATGGVI
jgi:hypothetical protein